MIEQQNPTVTPTGTNTLATAMRNYADYNFWANTTLISWLRTKEPALLEKEVPSSFPTIKLTLVHIWQTQCYWLSVLNKEEYVPEEFTGTVDQALSQLQEQSETFATYVREMTAEDIADKTLIINPWFECNFENFEYIIQVMNHSTYHRGQIITIGRNLGFTDAPMTDYNYYKVFGKKD